MKAGFIIFFLFFISQFSFAGQGKGGGIGFLCSENVYLADTYNQLNNLELKKLNAFSEDTLLRNSFVRYQVENPYRGNVLFSIYKNLKFIPQETVQIAGDDQIHDVPFGCEKVAIGLQVLETGTVYYNKNYYEKLSSVDKAYFKFHESLIQYNSGLSDTTPIRDDVAYILKSFLRNTDHELLNFFLFSKELAEDLTVYCSVQQDLYKCQREAYIEILNRLEVKDRDLEAKSNLQLLDKIKQEIYSKRYWLETSLGISCPRYSYLASYGSSSQMESLFCQYLIKKKLVIDFLNSKE